MNTIFLVCELPMDLIIAVRTGKPGYHGAYDLFTAQYGWSDCDKILDSQEFEEISLNDLPEELKSDHGFQLKKSHIDKIFIHKQ